MIIGHIENFEEELYPYPEAIKKAMRFLKENDCAAMEPGTYEIDGKRIYAMVQKYQTRAVKDCRAETHAKYIDIQYVAKGQEYMGWCPLTSLITVEENCLAEKDAIFYKNLIPESDLLLEEGVYAILYPQDVHRPCSCVEKPEFVTKVVIKIAVDVL
jgi:YhcH/YjgK/YiaL family protein